MKTNTPKLRFPEFQGAPAWAEKGLEEVAFFVNEKISVDRLALTNYVSTENILPDYAGVTVGRKLPPTGNVTKYTANDVLISNIRPYLKKICIASQDGGASNDVIVVRAKDKISSLFLSFILRNDCFVNYVTAGAKGLKMPRGDISLIKKYCCVYPQKPEQQKIADCLSSLDGLIATESRKLDALASYKKGLMQQLFPAEGETIPKLRFPEFRNAPAWKETALEKICKSIGGGTPSKQVTEYWNGSIPWISSSDLVDDSISKIIISRHITKDAIENSSTKLCPRGTICIVSRVGVGKVAVSSIELCTSQDFTNLINLKGDTFFVAYLLLQRMKKESERTQGTSIKGIAIDEIRKLVITIPSLAEQQKIANCLASLDELIAMQTEKLDSLKNFKKGMMQQLFPAADEVSV